MTSPADPADRDPGPTARSDRAAAKDAFTAQLRQLRADCGSPSGSQLEAISVRLRQEHSPPGSTGPRLPALSKTAISEVLAGKRQNLQSAEWVTMFVLSCQRMGAHNHTLTHDPGMSTIPGWQAKLRQARRRPKTSPGTAARPAGKPLRLTPRQHESITSHGRYGKDLLARIEAGQPDAIFRVAVLLGCEPGQTGDAQSLLLRAASSEYRPAIDLLDENPRGHLDRPVIARCAERLAQAAETRGDSAEAGAFRRAAARAAAPDPPAGDTTTPLEERGHS